MKWVLEEQEREVVDWDSLVQEWKFWRAPVNR